ncbi:ATP-binding protein [Rhizobium sp. 9T]|uniref:ATP-binding protein n=1 Tax=Rhizobium croatiense TaxID=2867516 RepID=UPI001C9369F9|nr:ATP-binding protein [Rhizobium croatiense]MBY4611615.1 ATP-binding protein [Rhizobium croatiense]
MTDTSKKPMRAGGQATEAGMAFQAEVACWFAVHILVRLPVGGRLGINNESLPTGIRLETGEGLDDIEVEQSDHGVIQIQCKTKPSLATGEKAPLTKTIGQLAEWVAMSKAGGGLPDLTRNVAVLAVKDGAPASLDNLEEACRAFDLGGTWSKTKGKRSLAQQAALDAFETIARPAWKACAQNDPGEPDLVDMARIFRIARFSMTEGASDWREASRLLGRRLYGNEAAGDEPLRALKNILRAMIKSGAPADRNGLLQALRSRGYNDTEAPGFDTDVARLKKASADELARLSAHAKLRLGSGLSISRECDSPLLEATAVGSLLVIGEPGAGKTGALVGAASTMSAAGATVVLLSVDRFPGIRITQDLATELGLEHPLLETLAAFPGSGPKRLIIDALDAARGGAAEAVFASLIEDATTKLGPEWSVVASIRTFDLKNGQRFKHAFGGAPPFDEFAEAGLKQTRHFRVPRLTDADLVAAGETSPEIAGLLQSAPQKLHDLFRNVFNLSLAAQLLDGGTSSTAFSSVQTQSGLIDVYENLRLPTTPMKEAAGGAARTMLSRGRLSVRKLAIGHPALDEVLSTGLLDEAGDIVSFAHHVLFDHVAGRFYLAWDDPEQLVSQLIGDAYQALLLAPALSFAVERMWRLDPDHRDAWDFLALLFADPSVDLVLANVALRVCVESAVTAHDVSALVTKMPPTGGDAALVRLMTGFARFALMKAEAEKSIAGEQAMTWAVLATALIANGDRALSDPGRLLLIALTDHGDLSDPALNSTYGSAARQLLRQAWSAEPPMPVTVRNAITAVAKSFSSDPVQSRELLDRILREPHFSKNADVEAHLLAQQIVVVAGSDPDFMVEIYQAFYSQTIDDETTSWFGAQPSRIMTLSSTRKQDFESCHWDLGKNFGSVLSLVPGPATRALILALEGQHALSTDRRATPVMVDLGDGPVELRRLGLEFNAWEDRMGADPDDDDDDLLRRYARFLEACTLDQFSASASEASTGVSVETVWARILGVGSRRVTDVLELVWPFVSRPDFFTNLGTCRDAILFVAAAWPHIAAQARRDFEANVILAIRSTADVNDRWRYILGRLFPAIPEDDLQLEESLELRRELAASGELVENLPAARFRITRGDLEDVERAIMRRSGVDIEKGSDSRVHLASSKLSKDLSKVSDDAAARSLSGLWRKSVAMLALIDKNTTLSPTVDQAAWGNLSNAVERITSHKNFKPGQQGLPALHDLFAVLDRLSASPYPEPEPEGEGEGE